MSYPTRVEGLGKYDITHYSFNYFLFIYIVERIIFAYYCLHLFIGFVAWYVMSYQWSKITAWWDIVHFSKQLLWHHIIFAYYCMIGHWPSVARETWVRSQIESYQRLKKWYLMPPCLTLSIIRYGSRVKWSNPGNGVAPSPTHWCSKLSKREPSGNPRLWSPALLYFIVW